MAKYETFHYQQQSIRLVYLDSRWWVVADDAAPNIGDRVSPEELFDATPETERCKINTKPGSVARLVSARYLIRLLRNTNNFNRVRFRSWLKAWKIVNGSPDLSSEN